MKQAILLLFAAICFVGAGYWIGKDTGYNKGYEDGALHMAYYVSWQRKQAFDNNKTAHFIYDFDFMSIGLREYIVKNDLHPQSEEAIHIIDSTYTKYIDSLVKLYGR